jgi:hypothetical protein
MRSGTSPWREAIGETAAGKGNTLRLRAREIEHEKSGVEKNALSAADVHPHPEVAITGRSC